MKLVVVIIFLVVSLGVNAQVEVYFPRYRGAIKTIKTQKQIQESDTLNSKYITTEKHTIYNRYGKITELRDYNYLTQAKYVYNYNGSVLNGSKIHSENTDDLLTVSTINYVTNDSIVEVLMKPDLKPLVTKIIVKKGNEITSNFYVNKGEDTLRTNKIYLLNEKGLVVKSTERRFRNNKLFYTLVETTNYTKFDEFGNYIEATGTVGKFKYKTTRTITYEKQLSSKIDFNKPRKSLKLGVGYDYSFGKPNSTNFHLLDIMLTQENQYRHGNTKTYSIGTEVSLNTHKVILGPKIGMHTRVFGILFGASLVNYTDFTNNTLRLVPEIGLGGDEVTFTIKPHIILTNKNFRPVNNISASLTYFFNL